MSPICGTHLFLGIRSTKARHSEASPFRKLIPPSPKPSHAGSFTSLPAPGKWPGLILCSLVLVSQWLWSSQLQRYCVASVSADFWLFHIFFGDAP